MDMEEVLKDVIRLYRERHVKPGLKPRPYLEAMAFFQIQAQALLCQRLFSCDVQTKKDHLQFVDRCMNHLALNDCPALETIQLQVITEAAMDVELERMARITEGRKKAEEKLMQEIINIKSTKEGYV
eukprot:Gb_05838 [translate_table: standard]